MAPEDRLPADHQSRVRSDPRAGLLQQNPGADIATRQMLNKPPLPFTKGLRLGNMPQIRTIVDEELESVWTGKKTPQQALDSAVERGNQLLRRFEQSTKS